MEPTPAPDAVEKKSWFDTVVVSTPVLLTIIATFLIGRSSAEMTQAQYYRAVASQNQSKVGDQWSFFQAKRIRGQILEGNADLLAAQKRGVFDRDSFPKAINEWLSDLHEALEHAGPIKSDVQELIKRGEQLLTDTKAALQPPDSGWKGVKHVLKPKAVQTAFSELNPGYAARSNKPAEDRKESAIPADQAKLLDDIVNDIKKRKLESEIAPKVLQLSDDTLKTAIQEADKMAAGVADRGKAIDNVLEEFDVLIDRQTALTREFQHISSRAEGLKKTSFADHLRNSNAQLQGDYKAVRHAFSARRYEDDARSNQTSAYLYEVKVLLASARSDKHLYRSQMFLLAMLIAQAAVTIATLALAVKRKSVFWLLATLTGLAAIAFGIYVFLDMPLPSF